MSSNDPAPEHPASPYSAAPEERRTATAGRVALIAGLIVLASSLLQQALLAFLPLVPLGSGGTIGLYQAIQIPFAVVTLVLGATAVIAGIIGLRAPGQPRGAAAAGLALGGSALASLLLGFTISAAYQLLRF